MAAKLLERLFKGTESTRKGLQFGILSNKREQLTEPPADSEVRSSDVDASTVFPTPSLPPKEAVKAAVQHYFETSRELASPFDIDYYSGYEIAPADLFENPVPIFQSHIDSNYEKKIIDFTLLVFTEMIKFKYEWTALFQFFLFHHWLKEDIRVKDFVDYINETIPKEKLTYSKKGKLLNCTYNSVNDYAKILPNIEQWEQGILADIEKEKTLKITNKTKTKERKPDAVKKIKQTIEKLESKWDDYLKSVGE